MPTIAYSQVQELVMRLPVKKLPLAYDLLASLVEETESPFRKEADPLSPQVQFMLLPLAERRRRMAQQAEKMVTYYEQSAVERQAWQTGDLADED
jgi:hypothetical protein